MTENIVHMHPGAVTRLLAAASYADLHGTRLRILTGQDKDGDRWVKWDCGDGVGWTPRYYEVDATEPKWKF
jgi:hypothetical protein